ncbi:GNAT family N-acetyltransferase [Solibacillus silvestris]|uniref:GNAT family N-acetyltransferase n=1 Tax=Solibacillus silvestris TaxID=76853 RepID=UPI003F80F3C6
MMYSKKMVQGIELTSENFHKAADLFETLKHHLSIKGVIKGTIAGRVFLSNDCASALLTSPQGIFLAGSTENNGFFEEVHHLIKEELLPGLASSGELDYVLFYPADEKWDGVLKIVMKDLLPMRSGRMTFIHDLSNIDVSTCNSIIPVNSNLLQRQNIIGLSEVINEILENWPSIEAYEANGFGCVAVLHTDQGPTIISWCLTDWVVDDECEIGIETDENYRGNGWARKTALGVLELAKKSGMRKVGWQCWSNNIASQRTALSVGFKPFADFPVLFGWNHPQNNLLVNGNHYMLGDHKYGVEKDYARAAWSYAQALDEGWDWNGDMVLYWNAACMFYLTGELEQAKHYYKKAAEKGWKDIHQPHYHEYVYREEDSEQIARILSESLNN